MDSNRGSSVPPKVLVVDDNPTNRIVAVKLVERMGCMATTAVNGSEALQAMCEDSYDIVLMDCMMPVMDGFDAARAIRQMEHVSGRRTPIVATTTNTLPHDRARCFEAGMDDFLAKPLLGKLLETVLSRWCPSLPHAEAAAR